MPARSAGDRQTFTANGQVGADAASFQVGDTTYGFQTSVAWTDAAVRSIPTVGLTAYRGSRPSRASRFGVAVIWHGNTGYAQVLWVDCQA